MGNRSLAISISALLLAALAAAPGCSESPSNAVATDAGRGADGGPLALEVPCADTKESIYADPGPLPADKGAIMRCSPHKTFTKEELENAVKPADGRSVPPQYRGKPFTSGAKVFRVTYRTERGTVPPTPGFSSALVYLPDTPAAPTLPVIVIAHGSRGQGAKCAPSQVAPEGEWVRPDFEALVFPYVGLGYAVIAPDGAGYANYGAPGNPPSAYNAVDDVGKSLLDGVRAMRKLLPSRLSDKVALVGHSQGGHSVLAALAISNTYGVDGTLAGVVAHVPLWFSQRSWGAVFNLELSYKVGSSAVVPTSIWYHYTHGELLDGPGGGLLPFKESIRPKIKEFVDTVCWDRGYPLLESIGQLASDFFDPAFVEAVSATAGFDAPCPTEPTKKAICEKWIARYKADRPKFTGAASKVPLFVSRGGLDLAVPSQNFQCAVDYLTASGSPIDFCYAPDADHSGLVLDSGDIAIEWIANKTLGTPMTKKCASDKIVSTDDAGAPIECLALPPND